MTSQFDASFAYTGPLSAEVQAAHAGEIERLQFMLSKIANAKLHANNELQRWVLACNRLVWGAMPADDDALRRLAEAFQVPQKVR